MKYLFVLFLSFLIIINNNNLIAQNDSTKTEDWNFDFEDWEWIGQDDGGRISAASTCLPYHGQLYVSQVFDGFILKIPYTKGQ